MEAKLKLMLGEQAFAIAHLSLQLETALKEIEELKKAKEAE